MSIQTQIYRPFDKVPFDKVSNLSEKETDTDDDTDDLRTVRSSTTFCSATTVKRSNVSYQTRAAATTTTIMSDQKSRPVTKYSSLQAWANSLDSGLIHYFRDGLGDDAVRSSVIVTIQAYVPSRKNNPPDQAEVTAALNQALLARQPPPGEVNHQDQEEQGLSSIDGDDGTSAGDSASTSQQTHGSIRTQNTIGAVNALVSLRGVAGNNPGGPNLVQDEKSQESGEREQQQHARAGKRNKENNDKDDKNKKQRAL